MELIPGFDLSNGGIAPPPDTAKILIVDDEPRIRLAYRQLLAGAEWAQIRGNGEAYEGTTLLTGLRFSF